MIRVELYGHRDWAKRIYEKLVDDSDLRGKVDFLHINTILPSARYADLGVSDFSNLGIPVRVIDPEDKQSFSSYLDTLKPDFVLMYGWSWIIPAAVTDNHRCICLHPSLLPKYRGGTPLQHQIINGETEGGVTLFIMNRGMDDGDIVGQESIPLTGDISDIFDHMVDTGFTLSKRMLLSAAAGTLVARPQDHAHATSYKRRTREQSEITPDELETKTATYIFNKIRALQDPYPNAYLTFAGKMILLKQATLLEEQSNESNECIIDAASLGKLLPQLYNKPFLLHLPNGAVRVTEYTLKEQHP